MKKRVKGIGVSDVIIGLVLLTFVAVLIYAIVIAVKNAASKIDEGLVVDKNYRASYISYTYTEVGDTQIMIPHTVPESYSLTIQGKKNSETVEYSFNVPEQEYLWYAIGDYYPKQNIQS